MAEHANPTVLHGTTRWTMTNSELIGVVADACRASGVDEDRVSVDTSERERVAVYVDGGTTAEVDALHDAIRYWVPMYICTLVAQNQRQRLKSRHTRDAFNNALGSWIPKADERLRERLDKPAPLGKWKRAETWVDRMFVEPKEYKGYVEIDLGQVYENPEATAWRVFGDMLKRSEEAMMAAYLPNLFSQACDSCTHCLDAESCDQSTCDDCKAPPKASTVKASGGTCRHCSQHDDYAEVGDDGLVCCWQCADKEVKA